MEYRRKRLILSRELFLQFFREGFGQAARVVKDGLPADARIVHVGLNERGNIVFVIESETYPDVPEGLAIPEAPSPVYEVIR